MNQGLVEQRVAIVTGGGRGLGAATSELFAQAGAKVFIVARTGAEIDALAERLRSQNLVAHAIQADVSKMEECKAVIDRVVDHYGRVDILINNAAVAHPFQRIDEVDPAKWVDAVNINLMGPFYMARFALPGMLERGYGRIVNVSSGLALRVRVGQSAYCVSKAGLEMLMRGLAIETEGTDVVITSYDPGMIDTPMQEEQRALDAAALRIDTDMFHNAWREGRLRDPAYVAQGMLWLMGPWGADRNGQRFSINDEEFRSTIAGDLELAE